MLAGCVASLAPAGVSHLVAVDGAYALFPGGKARSPLEQRQKVAMQAEVLGLTLHVPDRPWAGNEVEKRTKLLALAYAVADPGDWFLIIDADERISAAPDLERLWEVEEDAAVAIVRETLFGVEVDSPYVRLLRAQPLVYDTNHWTIRRPDGKCVGGSYDAIDVPLADMSGLRLEHRHAERQNRRMLEAGEYYRTRDKDGTEVQPCAECGNPSQTMMPSDWQERDGKPIGIMVELCDPCAHARETADELWFTARGWNYADVPLLGRPGGKQLVWAD